MANNYFFIHLTTLHIIYCGPGCINGPPTSVNMFLSLSREKKKTPLVEENFKIDCSIINKLIKL